jgi:hypothetical protein
MLKRFTVIIIITYTLITYVLHLTPVESMFVYAAALVIVFPVGEIIVASRS